MAEPMTAPQEGDAPPEGDTGSKIDNLEDALGALAEARSESAERRIAAKRFDQFKELTDGQLEDLGNLAELVRTQDAQGTFEWTYNTARAIASARDAEDWTSILRDELGQEQPPEEPVADNEEPVITATRADVTAMATEIAEKIVAERFDQFTTETRQASELDKALAIAAKHGYEADRDNTWTKTLLLRAVAQDAPKDVSLEERIDWAAKTLRDEANNRFTAQDPPEGEAETAPPPPPTGQAPAGHPPETETGQQAMKRRLDDLHSVDQLNWTRGS